ncbi:hypothetical protein C0995_012824 [Termitomyces sp. Mi166|nr:hypothetical protein C0995_012824 [Termitomyces sp. Mi166\
MPPLLRITNMANIILSAKSGSDWSHNELAALDITITPESTAQFFGCDLPSVNHLDPNLFIPYKQWHKVKNNCAVHNVLSYMGQLMENTNSPKLIVNMYTTNIFQALDFDSNNCIVVEHYPIPLMMQGSSCWAKTNVALMSYDHQVFCIVQENKFFNSVDFVPEAQLMAEAIAAAQVNNTLCKLEGLPAKDMTIMAIAMVGMVPEFYEVLVSLELLKAVKHGGVPPPTIIRKCQIRAPHLQARVMLDAKYRKYVIQHYLFFHDLVNKNSLNIMT